MSWVYFRAQAGKSFGYSEKYEARKLLKSLKKVVNDVILEDNCLSVQLKPGVEVTQELKEKLRESLPQPIQRVLR